MCRRHVGTIVVPRMREYAVFWRDSGSPRRLYAGALAVSDDRVRLRGTDGAARVVADLPTTEIAAVDAATGTQPIAGFPSFRLDLQNGRSIVVASAMGAAALLELVETLLANLPG